MSCFDFYYVAKPFFTRYIEETYSKQEVGGMWNPSFLEPPQVTILVNFSYLPHTIAKAERKGVLTPSKI